jgi:hypothetical protein
VIPDPAKSAPAPRAHAPQRRAPWWRLSFSADTWRRTLYVLLALPVGIVCVPLSIFGASTAAARLQRGLAARLLALHLAQPRSRRVDGRVIGHALLSLPLNVVAWVLIVYLWGLVVGNLAYPLRPDSDDLANAWGGPSLAGAWAVHGAAGLALLLVAPWIVNAVTAVQGRLLRRMLSSG